MEVHITTAIVMALLVGGCALPIGAWYQRVVNRQEDAAHYWCYGQWIRRAKYYLSRARQMYIEEQQMYIEEQNVEFKGKRNPFAIESSSCFDFEHRWRVRERYRESSESCETPEHAQRFLEQTKEMEEKYWNAWDGQFNYELQTFTTQGDYRKWEDDITRHFGVRFRE